MLKASIYAAIIVIAAIIGGLFLVEYQLTQQLLANNKSLLQTTVNKTFKALVDNKIAQYPNNRAYIEKNWRTLSSPFLFRSAGKIIYPHQFKGSKSSVLSDKWRYYETFTTDGLNGEERVRVQALAQLKQALVTEDAKTIKQAITSYFEHVENYQLSPLSEVISGLMFLQINTNHQWNPALIEQLIFTDNGILVPITNYIFLKNKDFSYADLKKVVNQINSILEQANLATQWFNQNVDLMTLKWLETLANPLVTKSVVNEQWLYAPLPNHSELLIPFNIEDITKQVSKTLTQQGLLNSDDSIALMPLDWPASIESIEYKINKPLWVKADYDHKFYLVIKLALLSIAMAALIFVVKVMFKRYEKKHDYLNAKEQFIHLVSHEFKTPLAALRIMSETLAKRAEKQLDLKDYPERIITEIDHLWLMVDNLLSVNRLKSDNDQLNCSPINLYQTLNRVTETFARQSNRNIQLSNNLDPTLILHADPLLIELVLNNLISNAVKYCDKTEVLISVEFDSKCFSIIFTDNGIGIAKADWQKVFNQFERLPQKKSIKGTGIGLYLCKLIMDKHQAKMKIAESNSNGTRWLLSFNADNIEL